MLEQCLSFKGKQGRTLVHRAGEVGEEPVFSFIESSVYEREQKDRHFTQSVLA